MTPLQRRIRAKPLWTAVRERDLLYCRVSADETMVVACDSTGGLGPKPSDTVEVTGFDVGRFATRVPLLEVVAAGASPAVVVDTLSVELDSTGKTIIGGVRVEAADAGLGSDAVTGSTEDNVPTVATGVGVTVVGHAPIGALRVGSARPGDLVVVVGHPRSAPEHRFGPDTPGVLSVPALAAALMVPGVTEALPIGSGGITAEIDQLARSGGLRVQAMSGWPFPRDQSGGPSTAALVAVTSDLDQDTIVSALAEATGLPASPVARLHAAVP